MWNRKVYVTLLPMVAAACSGLDVLESGEPARVLTTQAIQTDSSVYHVRRTANARELTINLAFTNASGGTAHIEGCQRPAPPALQKRENDRWVTAYVQPTLLCYSPPTVIRAGETFRYAYHVVAFDAPNRFPRFEVKNVAGTYRVLWFINDAETGEPLPLEQRVSNEFEIRETGT